MNTNSPTHGIKAKDRLGYAMGDMGGILTFALVNSFLTMFYTDVLGISPDKLYVKYSGSTQWGWNNMNF